MSKKEIAGSVCMFVGYLMSTVGIGLISVPYGLVFGGLSLLIFGIALDRAASVAPIKEDS